jgi:AraC-like DNA-binding protein
LDKRGQSAGATGWRVWDTAYVPEREAFSLYREAACESFLRLSPDRPDNIAFAARVEHLPLGDGAINRVHTVPHDVIRKGSDVARIDGEFLHLNFQTSGRYLLQQAGRESEVRAGDAVLFGSSLPFRLTMHRDVNSALTSLLIPRQTVVDRVGVPVCLDNVLVSRLAHGAALRSCLSVLSARAQAGSLSEIRLLKDAAVSLLCATLTADNAEAAPTMPEESAEPPLLVAIKAFLRRHLGDQDLSAETVAARFGVSRRYVDKLFRKTGGTFEQFVLAERLSVARLDLLDRGLRQETVATVAYRWGFRDLSMFYRNFKAAFGETPGSLRYHG